MVYCGNCGKKLSTSGTCECGYIAPERTPQNRVPYKILIGLNIINAMVCGIVTIFLLFLTFYDEGIIAGINNAAEYEMANVQVCGVILLVGVIAFISIPVICVVYTVNAFKAKGFEAYKLGKINTLTYAYAPLLLIFMGILTSIMTSEVRIFGMRVSADAISALLLGDEEAVIVLFFTIPALIFGAISRVMLKRYPPLDGSIFQKVEVSNKKTVEVVYSVASNVTQVAEKIGQSEAAKSAMEAAGKLGQSAIKIGKSLEFNVINEDSATVSIGGKAYKIGLVMKVISATLCVLFFLPTVSIGSYGYKVAASGWSSTFGVSIGGRRAGGSPVFIFLLLIPMALFCVYQFKNSVVFLQGKLFLVSAGLSGGGLLFFIIGFNSVNSLLGGYTKTGITFWSFVSIVLYFASGVISICCLQSAKNSKTGGTSE